jgi:hypothetical protein
VQWNSCVERSNSWSACKYVSKVKASSFPHWFCWGFSSSAMWCFVTSYCFLKFQMNLVPSSSRVGHFMKTTKHGRQVQPIGKANERMMSQLGEGTCNFRLLSTLVTG